MRKLPRSGARRLPERRFRGWLATWLQDRRRARQQPAAPTPNAPTITSGSYTWDVTTVGWADITLNFTFVHGTFPVATIEIWQSLNGGAYSLLATVASTATSYYYALATNTNATFDFKMRYVNGGTVGPYSNVYRVDVAIA